MGTRIPDEAHTHLTEPRPDHAQASSFVRHLAATYGDRAVIALWEATPTERTIDQAFRTAFGVGSADAHAGWRASLRRSALHAPAFQRAA